MPFCPQCRSEYREGFEVCGTCNVKLVENLDDFPEPLSEATVAKLTDGKRMVVIARDTVEACKELQHALLTEQMPAIIKAPENAPSYAGVAMVLEVMVPEELVDTVREIFAADFKDMMEIEDVEAVEARPRDAEAKEGSACPACGSEKPLEDGECPDCGLCIPEG